MRRKIGVHVSVAGGVHTAFQRADALAIDAVQLFLKNNNRWQAPPYGEAEKKRFLDLKASHPDLALFAHSGYLINIAGEGETREKSLRALVDELHRARLLGVPWLVLHPGSHGGAGEERGMAAAATALDLVLDEAGNGVGILLETTAGQGNALGYRFEQLARILELTRRRESLGICLDTCHVFAAGYDLATPGGVERTVSDFERVLGLEKLRLIHLNDSKRECGSRVDRHEHIGQGLIGAEGIGALLRQGKLAAVPCILETPKFDDDAADHMNLDRVRSLLAG